MTRSSPIPLIRKILYLGLKLRQFLIRQPFVLVYHLKQPLRSRNHALERVNRTCNRRFLHRLLRSLHTLGQDLACHQIDRPARIRRKRRISELLFYQARKMLGNSILAVHDNDPFRPSLKSPKPV